MQIYNLKNGSNKQRFYKSLAYSIGTGLLCAIAIFFISNTLRMRLSILYLALGMLVAKSIHAAGGGIGSKYSLMGAIVTIISILFSEMFIYFGLHSLLQPMYWFTYIQFIVNAITQQGVGYILPIFFMVWGVYLAYTNSNIEN